MPFRHFSEIAKRLIEHGLPADTPALCVSWLSYPQQTLVTAPLLQIGEVVAQSALEPPSLMVVGDVVGFWKQLKAQEQTPEDV
jgi:siroheme synthase